MSGGIPIVGPGEHNHGPDASKPGNPLQERDPNVGAASHDSDSDMNVSPEPEDVLEEIKPRSKATKSQAEKSQASKPTTTKKKQEEGQNKDKDKSTDLSQIHLDGEEDEKVPIYATAGDIRGQIKSHLTRTKMAKAAFARELDSLLPNSEVSPRGLDRFLSATGPQGAANNPAFYAAYVWFEKKRLQDGKKKGKNREEMEKVWGKGGFPRKSGAKMRISCPEGSRPFQDKYGEVHVQDPVR